MHPEYWVKAGNRDNGHMPYVRIHTANPVVDVIVNKFQVKI